MNYGIPYLRVNHQRSMNLVGCIFCLHKELILERDIEFYKKCLNLTETVENSPWEFERMVQYIFNNEFK